MEALNHDTSTAVLDPDVEPQAKAGHEAARRRRRAPSAARGAAWSTGGDVVFDTIIRKDDGIYGAMVVGGPSPESAAEALRAVRESLQDTLSKPGLRREIQDPLFYVNRSLLDMNERRKRDESGPAERQVWADVILAVSRDGGFRVAHFGSNRAWILRGGRLLPATRQLARRGSGGGIQRDSLGSDPVPSMVSEDIQVEGGDSLVLATFPLGDRPEAEAVDLVTRAARGEGLQKLADSIGAVVTIPVVGPPPKPEVGRANGLSWAAVSRIGLRPKNEDAYRVAGEAGIFALADGLGGHQGGTVAARTAVDTIAEVYQAEGAWVSADATAARAYELASGRVRRRTQGGGTTLEAVRVRDSRAHIAHVGDSRIYLMRDGDLEQITSDHSWVADQVRAGALTAAAARSHPQRNVITKALGGESENPDLETIELRKRDVLLLCSDGLTGPLEDGDIAAILKRAGRNLRAAAAELVDAAYERGAPDNVTVVLVRSNGIGKRGNR